MSKLILVAHPKVNESVVQNFLLAGLSSSKRDVEVVKLDLGYDVAEVREKILAATELIIQFPLYWYQAPSSLAKFFEETLTNQFVAQLKRVNHDQPKKFQLVVSFSDKLGEFQAGTKIGRGLSEILSPYQSLATSLGFLFHSTMAISQFAYMSEEEQQMLLIKYLLLVDESDETFLDRGEWLLDKLQKMDLNQVLVNYLADQINEYQNLDNTIQELKDGQK